MSDDFAAAAQRMYPSHGLPPAPSAEPSRPAADPAAQGTPPAAEPTASREGWNHWGEKAPTLTVQPDSVPAAPEPLTTADRMFNSPLASPQEVQTLMRLPADVAASGFDVTPEASAERREAATALHAAGLSRPEVEMAWRHAVRSANPGYANPDADATEAALRREYGADYEANMDAARTLAAEMVAKSPAIRRHLRDTGLQNDISLIRAVVTAAKRRAGSKR